MQQQRIPDPTPDELAEVRTLAALGLQIVRTVDTLDGGSLLVRNAGVLVIDPTISLQRAIAWGWVHVGQGVQQ